jgi:L-lactate dehydrogenase complex protein LldF
MERSARLGRFLQRPLSKQGRIRRLPLPVIGGWTRGRDFPALAERSFATIWREELSDGGDA